MNKSWNKIKEIILQLKGLSTIGIADLSGNAISSIFWFYMATVLGTEHYGVVSYFLAIAGIASGISLLGSENTLMIYTAKNVKIQPAIYFITIIFGSIISIILFLIFYNLGLSVLVLGYTIFGLVTSEILGRKLYTAYSKYLISQRLLMAGLAIGMYYLMGTDGVILGIALAFSPYSIRIYKEFKNSKIDFSIIKSRFSFMMNSYILKLLAVFGSSIDKLIIAPMLGFALLGNYQLGLQFLDLLLILPSIIYKYVLPRDASGNASRTLKKGTILLSIGLVILMIIVSPIVIPLIFPKFTKAVEIIQITSLSMIPASISMTYISKFLGNEKIKIVVLSSGISLTVQVPSIIILGKIFGVNGVAAAFVLAVLTQSFFLFLVDRVSREKTN